LILDGPIVVYEVEHASPISLRTVSREVDTLLGRPAAAFAADPALWARLIHPDDRAGALEAREALRPGISASVYRLQHADGTYRRVLDRLLPASGAVLRGCWIDLSGDRVARALERGTAQVRAALDAVPDGILIVDSSGTIQTANETAAQLFGHATTQLVGRAITDLLSTVPGKQGAELTGHCSDGGMIPLFGRSQPVNGPGQTLGAIFLRDLSSQWRLKGARDAFVSTVSVQLGGPLSVLEQVLAGQGELAEGQVALRQLQLVASDLMQLRRVQAERITVHREILDAASLVRAAVEANSPAAALRGIGLALGRSSQAPASILADPDHVAEVFSRLVRNAVNASPEGGLVSLQLQVATGSAWRFCVLDSGTGVAAARRGRVFEPLQDGGAGLGVDLAIARSLVQANGGRIGYDSAPGRGSVFWFELPDGHAPPAAISVSAASQSRGGAKK
jgi:signal transduction histidine kinase